MRIIILVASLLLVGCHTRQLICGGGVAERVPLVTLESVTETKDSPGRGYPIAHFPMPMFPMEMRRAGIEGEVVVRVTVGVGGLATSASIVKSTQPEFESAVLSVVQKWRFTEIRDAGVTQRTGMIVDCRIKFSFDES